MEGKKLEKKLEGKREDNDGERGKERER